MTLEQVKGCLLGQAVADALGAPFEGMPADAIYYGFGIARKIVAHPPVDELCYTDDTQMMIGVAETLAERGSIESEALRAAFVENFEPDRGYGPGAAKLLAAMARGEDAEGLARTIYPGGSLGNGAAMRAAPVGLVFHGDLDRAWEQAAVSALPTHVHPIGIEGAQLIATAVALAVRGAGRPFDEPAFWRELLERATTTEFRERLEIAAAGPEALAAHFGNGIEAHRSVVTSLVCFAQSPDSYVAAVARAIALGGDCDTVAAMAGAVSGARLGINAVPLHLLNLLENRGKGRDYLTLLAKRVWNRALCNSA